MNGSACLSKVRKLVMMRYEDQGGRRRGKRPFSAMARKKKWPMRLK